MSHLHHRRSVVLIHRKGFTVTELLVAIGIIVLLIGILLPVLGRVRQQAKRTQTISTMEQFSKACDLFHAEFGFYPGLVPETILAADPKISGTENALLHLMGGGVRREDVASESEWSSLYPPATWQEITFGSGVNAYRIKVNPAKIGSGPIVNGKSYAPFFSPKGEEFGLAQGQVVANDSIDLPDLLDAWGQPIIFVRGIRTVGPLVGDPASAQCSRACMEPYLTSVSLGELGKSQADSILNPSSGTVAQLNARFAQIIRNESTGAADQPLTSVGKGAYVLISAGPDGVFFSQYDGLGDPSSPQVDIVNAGPKVVRDYDDIRIFGGS